VVARSSDVPQLICQMNRSRLTQMTCTMECFFGYASVNLPAEVQNPAGLDTGEKEEHEKVWPMVMSVGWNPYFKNEKKTAEVHIMHDFRQDFYGQEQRVIVLGRIRPQFDYVSIEALMEDIDMDKVVALNSLARAEWKKYGKDTFFQFETTDALT